MNRERYRGEKDLGRWFASDNSNAKGDRRQCQNRPEKYLRELGDLERQRCG
jgi:hypothetical protein